MTKHISHDAKETSIEFVRAQGTLKAGAKAAGCTYRTIRNEMLRSPIFAKRIQEAQEDGKADIGDVAIENIRHLASEDNKDVRSRLTANIALANFAVPGFRGETKFTGTIDHNIRVKSAVPRPVYDNPKIIEGKKKISAEDKATLDMLNSSPPLMLNTPTIIDVEVN